MPTSESDFEFERSLKTVRSYAFIHKYLPFDRYVLRPPAGLIARAVFRTRVTPNNLTFISFLLAMSSAACYLGGSRPWFAAAGILALLSGIFDCADGMLARAKNLCSHYGAYLDLYLDRIGDFSVLTAMAFGCYRHTGKQFLLVLGLINCAFYLLILSLYYLIRQYKGERKTGEGAEARSLTISIIFAASVAGHPEWIIYGLLLESSINLVGKTVRFTKLGRTASAGPSPGQPSS